MVFLTLLASASTQAQRHSADRESAARDKEARDHYTKGIRYYDLGEIDEAIAEFRRAYELSAAPGLLFNIAQAYRLKKDYEQALKFYQTYLRLQPRAINRRDVEARMAEMEQLLKEQQRVGNERPHGVIASGGEKDPDSPDRPEKAEEDDKPQRAVVMPPPSENPPPRSAEGTADAATVEARPKLLSTKQGVAAVALAVVGVAAFGTTGALGGIALSNRSSYDRGCDTASCNLSLYDRAHRLAIGADVALGIGVAASVVSLVLFVVHPKNPARLSLRGLGVTF